MEYAVAAPVLFFWVAVVLIVFMVLFFREAGRRNKYRLLEKLAESGNPIPPELLQNLDGKPATIAKVEDTNTLASGVTLMCIGVGLTIFFWSFEGFTNPFTSGDAWYIAIGIFPFMIGLARVLNNRLARRPEVVTETVTQAAPKAENTEQAQ